VSETFDLRIDSIAAGGDGVGRHNGLVVFVPRTAPGDLARVRATQHDRLMRGSVLELLESSSLRVDPACEHYVGDRCGGCQLQHLLYEEGQLDAKAGIIRDSLTRIGKLQVAKPRVARSNKEWRYRLKLTLALRRRDGRWIAGLHRFDAPNEVFELRDCPITEERVLDVWKAIMQQQQFPVVDELRGAVRLTDEGFSFTLEGGHQWANHKAFFDAIPELTELWWKPANKSRRLLHSRASGETGASFVQVNPLVASDLLSWVLGQVSSLHPTTVVDAYAGTGDIAAALARQGVRVTAIELDRDAARVAASRLPDGSQAIAARVEDVLEQSLPADVVILNPPRAGVDAKVAELLRTQTPKPKAVVYVSCDPATLARDVRRMESYRIESLMGFDMFPQTAHVETVCQLVPAA